MRAGSVKRIKWYKYQTTKFKFPKAPRRSTECGAFALYVLTKNRMKNILSLSKNGHYSTHVMLKYLKDNGFGVIPVTLGTIVENHFGSRHHITDQHVLLIGQYVNRRESTWSVVYEGLYAHSGSVEAMDPLILVNRPICEAYVIWHPSWDYSLKYPETHLRIK